MGLFRCVFCQSSSQKGFDICSFCEQNLPWMHQIEHCQKCAINLVGDAGQCGECLTDPPSYDQTVAAIAYQQEAMLLLQQLKFHHQLVYSKVAGQILVRTLQQVCFAISCENPVPGLVPVMGERVFNTKPDVIIPVPLHWKRQIKRGFNQSAEIGRYVAKAFQIPMQQKFIKRAKHTQAQSGLTGEKREQNLKNAFLVNSKMAVPKHVAIIDDVVTTGATVNAMARCLKQAGVEWVDVWCVARTLKHGV